LLATSRGLVFAAETTAPPGSMTSHDCAVERDGAEVAQQPVHVGAGPGLVEHRRGRVQADEPPVVTGRAGAPQHRPRPAADIQHGPRRHDQAEVEIVARPSRAELVVKTARRGSA
jgi:hypothetical protein